MDQQQSPPATSVPTQIQHPSPSKPSGFLPLWIVLSFLIGISLTFLAVYFLPSFFEDIGLIGSNVTKESENTSQEQSKVGEDNETDKTVNLKPETTQWHAEEKFTGLIELYYSPSLNEPSFLVSMDNFSGAVTRRSKVDSLSQLILSQDATLEFTASHMEFPKKLSLTGSVLTNNGETLHKVRTTEGGGKIFYVRDITNEGFCEDDNLAKLDPPCGVSQMDGLHISCIYEGDGEKLCDSVMKTYNKRYQLNSQEI